MHVEENLLGFYLWWLLFVCRSFNTDYIALLAEIGTFVCMHNISSQAFLIGAHPSAC